MPGRAAAGPSPRIVCPPRAGVEPETIVSPSTTRPGEQTRSAADPRLAALEAENAQLRGTVAAAEERFQAAVGGLLDAFYVLEAERDAAGVIVDFRFLDLNRNGARIIGYTREEVVGQRLCELLPINRERGYFDKYAQVVETGEPLLQEDSFGDVEGIQASWLQFQAVKIGDGVAIHTKDITIRKRQEQETQRLYRELRMILDAVPSLIFYKDGENNVLRVNQAVADTMNMTVEQIEGRATEELWPEEAASYYRDDLAVLRSGKAKLNYIEKQTLPNGKRLWLRTDKSPLYDANGGVLGILAVVTDITEQRQSAFQAAVLDKAVEERQAMGRNLHDGIGQQFTGVRMLIEKVRKQARRGEVPEPAALDEIAGVVASASTEVRRMISGLTPERISTDELPVALAQVASNVENFYGVRALCVCDEAVAGVTLDEEAANHLLGIAQEAAINAAKHAGATCIEIRLAVDDAGLALTVLDDGSGMLGRDDPAGADPAASAGTGRGVQILHYRAAAIGAGLIISAAPEPATGTLVSCVLPI